MSEVEVQAPPAPVEETESALQTQLAQAAAENEALQARIRDLAVFQSQAAALTDGNTKLQEQVESLTRERDAAVKESATARGEAANAAASASSDATVVGHAHSLAAAIKGLLG